MAQPPKREGCLAIAVARMLLASWLSDRLTIAFPMEMYLVHMMGLERYVSGGRVDCKMG